MLSVSLRKAQFWVILAGCLCSLVQGNAEKECPDGLSDQDKNAICNKAVSVNGFCCDAGAADKGCEEIASTVKGSNPKCSSKNKCTFTKDGKTIHINSKDDPKENTVKDCIKNIRITDKSGGGGSGADDKNKENGGGGGGGDKTTPAGGGGNHHNGGGNDGDKKTTPSNGGDKTTPAGGGGNQHNGGDGDDKTTPSHKGSGGGGGGGNSNPPPSKSGGNGGAPTTPCAN